MTQGITAVGIGVAVAIKWAGYAVATRRVPMGWPKAVLWAMVRTGAGLVLALLVWRGLVQVADARLFSGLSEPWAAVCAWGIIFATFAGVRFLHWFATLSFLRGETNLAVTARSSALAVAWSFALDVVVVAAVWFLPWTMEIQSMTVPLPSE